MLFRLRPYDKPISSDHKPEYREVEAPTLRDAILSLIPVDIDGIGTPNQFYALLVPNVRNGASITEMIIRAEFKTQQRPF